MGAMLFTLSGESIAPMRRSYKGDGPDIRA